VSSFLWNYYQVGDGSAGRLPSRRAARFVRIETFDLDILNLAAAARA